MKFKITTEHRTGLQGNQKGVGKLYNTGRMRTNGVGFFVCFFAVQYSDDLIPLNYTLRTVGGGVQL